jgi:hypothetical protein
VAKDTDLAGNTGSSTPPLVLTLETALPTVAITTAGGDTNVASHTITGTVSGDATAPGSTVSLYDNGGTTAIGTALVQADGSWTATAVPLVAGANSIVAKDTDLAGNTGSSTPPLVLTLETALPTVAITTAGGDTNVASHTITGTVSGDATAPGSTVSLYDNGGTTAIGTALVGGDGSWSSTVTLAAGANSIVATDIDLAGNTGSSTPPLVLTLETAVPTVAITTAGGDTNVASHTITGTVSGDATAPGSTVSLYDNGGTTAIGTALVGGDGSWSSTVTLAAGANSIVATDIDLAGNTSNSTPLVFTLDTLGGPLWVNAVSGDWTNPRGWSTGAAPLSTDDAFVSIVGDGSYTVTIQSSDVAVADNLTISASSATVLDQGFLGIGGTLTVQAGVFDLDAGGTISGGTLLASGGTFEWTGGDLNGVIYQGTLDLSAASSVLEITGGLTVTDNSGSQPGTVNVTGVFSQLVFVDGQTFDNATVNLGNSSGDLSVLVIDAVTSNVAQTLTLGTGVTTNVVGNGGIDGNGIVVNEGIIKVANGGNLLVIESDGFENSGTISVGVDSTMEVVNGSSFANFGTITLLDGASAIFEVQSIPPLPGATATPVIQNAGGTIDDTGIASELFIQGDATLDSGTLNIGSSGNSDQGSLLWNYDPDDVGANLVLAANLTINVVGNAGFYSTNTDMHDEIDNYATINDTAIGSELFIQPDYFVNFGTISASGSNIIVDVIAVNGNTNEGTIEASNGASVDFSVGPLTNDTSGIIQADGTGVVVFESGTSISNSGLFEATNGGTLDVQVATVDNTRSVIGGIVIDDTSTLLVDTADLELTGGGRVLLEGGDIVAGVALNDPVLENLDNTILGFGTIGTGDGQLVLQNDTSGVIKAIGVLTIDTGNTVTNAGLIEAVSGGTLDIMDSTINWTGASSTTSSIDNGILIAAASQLLVDTSTLHLTGFGDVVLSEGQIADQAANLAPGGYVTLDNVSNTILGAGTIGSGDGKLALQNDSNGLLLATAGILTIDTGRAITNNGGLFEATGGGFLGATGGGSLVVDDGVIGTGTDLIGDGGILEFQSSVANTQTVLFGGAGTLDLNSPATFNGEIAGLSESDTLDISGFNAATTSVMVGSFIGGLTNVTVYDSSNGQSMNINLVGNYSGDNFAEAGDGDGGTLLVLNKETPIAITSQSHSFAPITSQVYQAHNAIISSSTASGLSINNTTDSTSSDLIVAELDQGSSISSTGVGFDGIIFRSLTATTSASVAIFNAESSISATGSGSIGIFASADANIAVNDGANTSVSGNKIGIEAFEADSTIADVEVNVGPHSNIYGTTSYGILAVNDGVGDISVRTDASDTIHSGSAGIDAVNEATPTSSTSEDSTIFVNAFGTINSGTTATGTNNPPAGIIAGYLGGTSDPTSYPVSYLYGLVLVNSSATITAAAGDGIRAFNYGTGDVVVNDNAGEIWTQSSPVDGFGNGISADNFGTGNIDVYTAASTNILSVASGISADNSASASPSTSEVSVTAFGQITSGNVETGNMSPAAGILAGYNFDDLADDAVHGNVTIDDYGSITATTGTDGIRGYNYGTGTITVIAEAVAVIDADRYGLAARDYDGGDISVINYASVSATTAIDAYDTTGNIQIANYGTITGDMIIGNPSTGGAPFVGNATIYNDFGGVWNLNGNSTFAGTTELINDGTIDATGTISITTTGVMSISNTGTVNVVSGSLDIAPPVTGTGLFTVASGTQLEFESAVSAGQVVTFQGGTGTLKLYDATQFDGQISGLSGADGLDLVGFSSSTAVVTPTSTAPSTILTVTDATHTVGNGTAATITLQGNYTESSFTFTQDSSNTGILIVDPPAIPANSTTIVATATNQTLTGTGASDNFVFNFAAIGQTTITNFNADADQLQFKSSIFANVQAILNATSDDGHGNTVIALDSHDSITLAGVLKAQLHAADFHLA